jgi:hypothetical protein
MYSKVRRIRIYNRCQTNLFLDIIFGTVYSVGNSKVIKFCFDYVILYLKSFRNFPDALLCTLIQILPCNILRFGSGMNRLQGVFFGFFFLCTLFNSNTASPAASQIPLCRRMLGSKQGLLRLSNESMVGFGSGINLSGSATLSNTNPF